MPKAITVGQTGTFHPSVGGGKPERAKVVHVWSDTCVNLVTESEGTPTSVLIMAPGQACAGYYFVPDAVDTIEAEIQAKGLTAARVTPADIEANIASEHYFTAADGFRLRWLLEDHPMHETRASVYQIASSVNVRSYASTCTGIDVHADTPQALAQLTFCVLVLRNGFTVTGESACASPENFDAEVGRKIARQNAVAKIWPLMGYELRSRLAFTEVHGVVLQRPDDAHPGTALTPHFQGS